MDQHTEESTDERGHAPSSLLQHAGTRLPLVVLTIACVVILSYAFAFSFTARDVSETITHGQGERFAMYVRDRWDERFGDVDDQTMSEILAHQQHAGLRYVAIVSPEEEQIIAQAGTLSADPELFEVGVPIPHDDTILFLVPAAPPRGLGRRPDRHRPPLEDRGPHEGPRPRGEPPPRRGPPLVIALQYEPLEASALDRHAIVQLLLAALISFVLLVLGWKLGDTLRKQEQLRARYQQRQRLAELGQMSAVLAHELRNPLTALKGHSQLLHEILEDREDPLARKTNRLIYESTRLEHLVNSLLAFVRTGELDLAPVDVSNSIERLVDTYDRVHVTMSEETGALAWLIDPVRLQIAFSNVLENAIQESPEGSSVLLHVIHDRDFIITHVEDNGPGIPRDALDSIFEPFTTFKVNGVGLGLAIARGIIETHGGTISAQNKSPDEGAGARFTIKIPRKH